MGTVTKTVGSAGGRDFSTWSAWAASLPANLVTDGNSYVGQGFNDSEFTSSGILLTLNGHTTDASHTITATTGAGQSFRDNASVRSNALTYNVSNGVGIRTTGNFSECVDVRDTNVTISNLQFSSPNNPTVQCGVSNGAANLTLSNCLFFTDATVHGGGGPILDFSLVSTGFVIKNCILIGKDIVAAGAFNFPPGGGAAYFCTVVCPSNATSSAIGIKIASGTITLENCAIFGYATCTSGGTLTATTCHTDQASPPSGFTQETYNNSYFVDSTADWRLASGSAAQGAGTSDSTNGAFDISGLARPQGSNWDIGAWELAVAATVTWGWNAAFDAPTLQKQKIDAAQAFTPPRVPFTPPPNGWQANWDNPRSAPSPRPTRDPMQMGTPSRIPFVPPPNGWDANWSNPRIAPTPRPLTEMMSAGPPWNKPFVAPPNGWQATWDNQQVPRARLVSDPTANAIRVAFTPPPNGWQAIWDVTKTPREAAGDANSDVPWFTTRVPYGWDARWDVTRQVRDATADAGGDVPWGTTKITFGWQTAHEVVHTPTKARIDVGDLSLKVQAPPPPTGWITFADTVTPRRKLTELLSDYPLYGPAVVPIVPVLMAWDKQPDVSQLRRSVIDSRSDVLPLQTSPFGWVTVWELSRSSQRRLIDAPSDVSTSSRPFGWPATWDVVSRPPRQAHANVGDVPVTLPTSFGWFTPSDAVRGKAFVQAGYSDTPIWVTLPPPPSGWMVQAEWIRQKQFAKDDGWQHVFGPISGFVPFVDPNYIVVTGRSFVATARRDFVAPSGRDFTARGA